ncbi:transposase [Acetobacter indonesiensis NRIC 0313]|uniref:Transposase n=1 Tax=Acetobacter indonesiensis TaxID=104101 RepID=A0A6N3T788_9PROT|nr:transposase [Acetobacter indonesiensis]GBQ61552.1 transposase [Acetobacter indonesiensis NRIC 0313]GEN03427.1 hypothetical protein AIN02nite_14520 [Acetobacter indonesiensis]
MRQPGFFDVDECLARLSGLGDQLEAFFQTVGFELFRLELHKALAYADGSKDGHPPFEAVLMFKILVIQTLNNLSDERTEYLINNRLSFMRFLGLGLSDRMPDAKTVWLCQKRLTQAGAIDVLFNRFDAILRNTGYLPMSGQILEATLVAPQSSAIPTLKRRLCGKDGSSQDWQDKPSMLSHKDRHVRWILKFTKAKRQEDESIPATYLAILFFGYKSHISIDRKFLLIRKWKATDAATSDGARVCWIKPICHQQFGGIRPYRSKANEDFMDKHGFVSKVHRKKPLLKPMPRHIQRSNAGKSIILSRVEHVFADQKSQTGLFVRTVGIARATMRIGLANIVYNMSRFLLLKQIKAAT